ncbi:MAG: ATP-binding protein [Nostoc sp.]
MRSLKPLKSSDTGSGMTEEIRDRLFDPFFTTKLVGRDTGLGLSISHQIVVSKHGGQIMCLSAPGQGTEFMIKIPMRSHPLELALTTPCHFGCD